MHSPIPHVCCLLALGASAAIAGEWWNPRWRYRTRVSRPAPYRDASPRPVEAALDLPLLLDKAGVTGELDPASVRLVERGRELPFAWRSPTVVAWLATPRMGEAGAVDVYFETRDRKIPAPRYSPGDLPPENLLANPGFEHGLEGWSAAPSALMRIGTSAHTTGVSSLQIAVDETTPKDASREAVVQQRLDVRRFAGQEMVFECDLLAERAPYGAPVCITIEQFRADGSRIREFAVQSRWLTIELAQGQLVQFRERGRFSRQAASVNVRIRVRCSVRDADTNEVLAGPESFFTVWLDRVAVRPCERWPWPPASHAGFAEGALEKAPVNRGFEFTGQRRLAFNGASEGTLTAGSFGDAASVHWGLQAGTLELWCRPKWNADDGAEHILFHGVAYGHRLQSRLRKLGAEGSNRLEFTIADAGGTRRIVRAPAPLRKGQWHHIAATWDFPKAHLQLFLDGRRIAQTGPGGEPWPFSLTALDKARKRGIGIADEDRRSLPMQAFIGGDSHNRTDLAAQAVVDELRISDIPRYHDTFPPPRAEFAADAHTRALFHFENDVHGVHGGDDGFVRGHLACELLPHAEHVPLEILRDGKPERRSIAVRPHPAPEVFERSRAENRLGVHRPFRALPDPRAIECRVREITRTVTGGDDAFTIDVAGDHEPRMLSVTFEHAKGAPPKTTLIPRWRANDNVVPFSIETLAATLAPDARSDAERAFKAFGYVLDTTNYFDAGYCETLPGGRHRPRISYSLIKALNIYPFDQCGPMNHMLRKLFLAAGISSNDASGTHHQFEQAFYDGRWRLFDLSSRLYWLRRDDATVASRRDVEEDPFLKLRQGGNVCAWLRGRRSRARFGGAVRPHRMDFPLRPGERVSICWHNEGRWFELAGDRKPIPLAKIPPSFGNGAILYRPTAPSDATAMDNLALAAAADAEPVLRAKDPAKPASLVYKAQCPYIFTDSFAVGRYAAPKPGTVALSLSFDKGKSWQEVWRSAAKAGPLGTNLLKHVSARYAYWIKLSLAPGEGAMVSGLAVRSTFAVSPLSLPGTLRRGRNRITFVGRPAVPVTTTCRWAERHATDLRVWLNGLSTYLDGDRTHRNVFVVSPSAPTRVELSVGGRRLRGEVALEGLPKAWLDGASTQPIELADPAKVATAAFALQARTQVSGRILGFAVVVREGGKERRIPAQALVADAPLVCEAEQARQAAGKVAPQPLAEASGAAVMAFAGNATLSFDLVAPADGTHALWLRARWKPGSSTRMTLALDDAKPRDLRAAAMIGFTDWADPRRAHTKMFAHFGEQYAHWAWYRIPDVALTKGTRRLTLGAAAGASFDALLLLPQDPTIDRAAMNLFQNWNFAPWQNPL